MELDQIIPVNFKGAAKPLSKDAINKAAAILQCDVPCVLAVAEVETGSRPYFNKLGQPYILFESAKFSKYTQGRFDKLYPSISKPAWIKDYGSIDSQYDRLMLARSLDDKAALKSASWGAFQIMGFNSALCGYPDVHDFVAAMCDSADNQLDAFVKFVQASVLGHYLKDHRWLDFARGYNGNGQVGFYADKLADAWLKHGGKRG